MVDRKALLGSAGIRADLCNIHRDPEKRSEPFTVADFLPELPEDRARRLADELEASKPPSPEAFEAFKSSLLATGTKKNPQ